MKENTVRAWQPVDQHVQFDDLVLRVELKALQKLEVQFPRQDAGWQFAEIKLEQAGNSVDVIVPLVFDEINITFGIEAITQSLDNCVGTRQAENALLCDRILECEVLNASVHDSWQLSVDANGLRGLDRLRQRHAKGSSNAIVKYGSRWRCLLGAKVG